MTPGRENPAWRRTPPGPSPPLGQFVVAVDADLREPSLHKIFDVALSPGVSDIEVASGPSDLLASTGNRYLELIPAGVPTRHPTDISAVDLPRLLRALRESDRTVVLDCPPIIGVAESTILVAKADAVVLVVDARKPNFENLQHGLAQIREAGGNVVGIVLNRVRRHSVTADGNYSPTRESRDHQRQQPGESRTAAPGRSHPARRIRPLKASSRSELDRDDHALRKRPTPTTTADRVEVRSISVA